jgi:hypothetical protein
VFSSRYRPGPAALCARHRVMTNRLHSKWAGSLSIVWMVAGYLLIRYVAAPRGLQFEPFWLCAATVFGGWLGVGLFFAIAGLRSGSALGRASAILALVLFALFAWHMLYPALKPARMRGSSWPNHAASGKAAVTSLLAVGHHRRGLPAPGP